VPSRFFILSEEARVLIPTHRWPVAWWSRHIAGQPRDDPDASL